MNLTEARAHLRDLLSELPGRVSVYAGPADYIAAAQPFIVRVIVGEDSDGAQEVLDAMLAADGPGSVKEALEVDRAVGVVKHSGYRLYPQAPGSSPLLGAEWTVNFIF